MAAGVTDALVDAELVPAELVAVTEQAYAVPFVRPVTVIGLDAPDARDELDAAQVAV